MDLLNKKIVEKRIQEKGPYIEGTELTFEDVWNICKKKITGKKINICVFDENDEFKTHDVYISYE